MARIVKAVVYERYGSPEVLELREVDRPVVGDGDVLIKVEAASVNRSDWETLTGRPFYARIDSPRRPRRPVLGSDIAGTVEQVGSAVELFQPGDEVFGDVMYHGAGGFAEYVCVSGTAPIVHKPSALSFAEASTLPQAALIALQALSDIESGDRVLINGAGGGTGGFAVQMAKTKGATVTGVDNGFNRSLFGLWVPTTRSITRRPILPLTDTNYDFILDLVASRSMFTIRRAVAPGGRYALVGGSMGRLLSAATLGRLLSTGGRRLGVFVERPNKEDLVRVADMVVAGELRTSIDRVFPLEGVPDALEQLGSGRGTREARHSDELRRVWGFSDSIDPERRERFWMLNPMS